MSSHASVKIPLAALPLCLITIVVTTNYAGLAQSPQPAPRKQVQRKIVSADFTQNRTAVDRSKQTSPAKPADEKQSKPKPSDTSRVASSKSAKPPKPAYQKPSKSESSDTYRLASSKPRKPSSKRPRTVAAQLGVTIWRLRPMTEKDRGATVTVEENGNESAWVAERVEADTVFRKGDFVRLSIESPRAGYLYVVNRDEFADKTTGDPMLIYPWGGMARGENQVRPGWLIDIPSQEDVPSYYKASPTRADQLGELLTIIVTKRPLDLRISDEPLRLSKAQFAQWQKIWKSDSDRFEMEGGAGRLWTEEERQAGSRIRTRQLTRKDPAPQTIYHVDASSNSGYLVNIRLAYAR